jgi:trehalose-6-phosphatase
MAVNPIQLQKHLSGLDYPATKKDLVRHARQRGADQDAVQTLESLPRDQFNSPNDVSEAIGDLH